MSKVNLSNVASLQNESTALSAINNNSNLIEVGFENTLSRDGTAPNSMNANLDMNSYRIFNLIEPNSATEPLRLQDLSNFIGGGTISTIPAGGTARQYLGKNSSTDFDVNWLTIRNPIDVRNFGVIGNGTADDTIAMQNAVAAIAAVNGGVIYIPAGLTILCSGPIPMNGQNITILGDSNKDETAANASTLIYSGTGARFFDGRDSRGLRLEGLRIQYSSSSFVGSLVDISGVTAGATVAAYCTVKNCVLETTADRTGTATLLNLGGTVDATIEKNFFRHGFPAILGQTSLNQSVDVIIKDNTFSKNDNVCISSGGEAWLIESNSFEPFGGLGEAFVNISSLPCHGMAWINNWFGDVTASGTSWIDGYFEGFTFIGNQMAGQLGINGTGITFRNSNGIDIRGNRFELLTNAINIATASTGIKMGANYFSNVTTPVANPTNAVIDDFTLASTGVTNLSTVNSNVGTFGSATQAPQYTVNGKGLITAASNVTITGTTPGGSAGGDLGGTYPNPTINNAPVIAKVLTGYTSGAGTVSASDSILSAIQKLNGNDATNANLTGDVTSVGNATTLTNAPVIAKVLTGYTSGAGTISSADSILSAIQKLNGNDATNANLTGDVTSVGNATTLTNAPVIAKVLTGYTSGAGTVSSADSILSAIQKLNGNDATNANLTGDVTSVGNATTLTNAPVIAKVLTGYSASAGTVASTDSILQAFQKLGGLVDNAAWSTYTSTFSATSGTATVVAKQKTIGKTIFVNIIVTFTSTVVGTFTVTLPTNSLNYAVVSGKEISGAGTTGGHAAGAYVNPASNLLNVLDYSGVQFLANGSTIVLTGSYESS